MTASPPGGPTGDRLLTIRELDQADDFAWVVANHGRLYQEEFGWDTTFQTLVGRIVADYAASHDPAREAAWMAEIDGRRVGCVFCVAADEDTAQLRILLVDPAERNYGIGGRLVDRCLAFSRDAGYRRMRLWTNDSLRAAQRLYLARGFRLVVEEPHHSFGVDLVGQTYELDLYDTTAR